MKNTGRVRRGRQIVGIGGMHRGIGTTFLTVALAGYLAESRARSVAVVEYNPCPSLDGLLKKAGRFATRDGAGKVSLFGVDYFVGGPEDTERIPRVLREEYEDVLVDFGTLFLSPETDAKITKEWIRCDRNLILVDSAPWRWKELEVFAERLDKINMSKRKDILNVYNAEDDKRAIMKMMGSNVTGIPYMEDPFALKREYFGFMDRFL